MKTYGDQLPFQRKKSGWWSAGSRKGKRTPLNEEDKKSRRWLKRIARRVGRMLIDEEQREVDPTKIHV